MAVNISGLDRADVLCALYNASRPKGMGFLDDEYDADPMRKEEAEELLKQSSRFNYLKGRVMKVTIPEQGTEIEEWLYDRDNGIGAAKAAIASLRSEHGLMDVMDELDAAIKIAKSGNR